MQVQNHLSRRDRIPMWKCVWKGDAGDAAGDAGGGGSPGPRSSHSISVVNDAVYFCGGEQVARVPVDSAVHRLALESGEWSTVAVDPEAPAPVPRIAHAQATTPTGFFIFGGREGVVMDEKVRRPVC